MLPLTPFVVVPAEASLAVAELLGFTSKPLSDADGGGRGHSGDWGRAPTENLGAGSTGVTPRAPLSASGSGAGAGAGAGGGGARLMRPRMEPINRNDAQTIATLTAGQKCMSANEVDSLRLALS